jgi:peptidoglycan/LPS O-acetylase OafA/YrhL
MQQEVTMVTAPRKTLGALTGARFLAAFWVVLYHYVFSFQETPETTTQWQKSAGDNPFLLVLGQGHLAVDFFFLLSGFILAYNYAADDTTVRGGNRSFWVARIARIYPVYLLGLLLGFGPYILAGHSLFGVGTAAFAHFLLIHAWFPSTLDWNLASWSLSVEAFFYLLFPLLLPFLARLSSTALWRAVLATWAAFALLLTLLWLSEPRYSVLWWWSSAVRYNPLVSLPEFIVGMALGLLFLRGDLAWTRLRNWSDRQFDWAIGVVGALFVAFLLVTALQGYNAGAIDSMAVLALPFFTALIALLAFGRGSVAHALARPRMLWLGEISYGIYIIHGPIWLLLSGFVIVTLHTQPSNFALFLAFLTLTVAVAGLSFTYLERPARRYIRARWAHPQPVTSVA